MWKKIQVRALGSDNKQGESELHLTNEGNCFFSQSTAFASMELEGFAFKAACSLWLLILGFFLLPVDKTCSQCDLNEKEL